MNLTTFCEQRTKLEDRAHTCRIHITALKRINRDGTVYVQFSCGVGTEAACLSGSPLSQRLLDFAIGQLKEEERALREELKEMEKAVQGFVTAYPVEVPEEPTQGKDESNA